MRIRRVIYFSGRVQGVGFRFTTENVARRFPVTGYVENLPDGRVHLVCEGEKSELTAFVGAVESEMVGKIDSTDVAESAATGEFDAFGIRYP